MWTDGLSIFYLPHLDTVRYHPSLHLHVTTPLPSPTPPPRTLLLASAQASDIVFGTALITALPRHAQRKVPLLLSRYGPVSCRLLAQRRGQLRRLQRGRLTQRLLPVKSQEVCEGVWGGNTQRRGVICERWGRLPGVVVVLHCNITEGTPLEGIYWQKSSK